MRGGGERPERVDFTTVSLAQHYFWDTRHTVTVRRNGRLLTTGRTELVGPAEGDRVNSPGVWHESQVIPCLDSSRPSNDPKLSSAEPDDR